MTVDLPIFGGKRTQTNRNETVNEAKRIVGGIGEKARSPSALSRARTSAVGRDEREAALDALLAVWADWMRQPDDRLGLPSKSLGMSSTSGDDFESLCLALDTRVARTMDALIDSLPMNERAAIEHVHLASVWRLRVPIASLVPIARASLIALALKRGLLE